MKVSQALTRAGRSRLRVQAGTRTRRVMESRLSRASRSNPASLSPRSIRVSVYEREIRNLARKVVRAEFQAAENAELRKRLREFTDRLERARKAKLKAESKESEYRAELTHLKSEHKAALKEHWDFAQVCLEQAEQARDVLQQAVRTSYDGKMTIRSTCTCCGVLKPVAEFPVRTTKGRTICYGPHCLNCKNANLRRVRRSLGRGSTPAAMAESIVDRAPVLVEAIADGVMEERRQELMGMVS